MPPPVAARPFPWTTALGAAACLAVVLLARGPAAPEKPALARPSPQRASTPDPFGDIRLFLALLCEGTPGQGFEHSVILGPGPLVVMVPLDGHGPEAVLEYDRGTRELRAGNDAGKALLERRAVCTAPPQKDFGGASPRKAPP